MRSSLTFLFIFVISLLLISPVFAQTEDELVAKYLKKAEKRQIKKVGFVVLNGSIGRLNKDNDYNYFVNKVSPLMSTATGSPVEVDGIFRTTDFYAGFGIVTTQKSSAQIGFNYWLNQGSTQSGDFNLSLVNLNDTGNRLSFELKSQIQIYGVSGLFDYYVMNPPDEDGVLNNFSFKLIGGGGYYFAKWDLWEGLTGHNLNTGAPEDVGGQLSGSALGLTGGVAVEYPINLGGIVVESSLKYLYLNFTGMKWYNSNNEQVTVTYNNSGDKVNLDMSGPRAQFGFKRYFSW
jgi:hypothetical protein